MPERYTDLLPVGVDFTCDKCGEGDMQHTGLTKDQPVQNNSVHRLFHHKCSKCKHEQLFAEIYPLMRMLPKQTPTPPKPTKKPRLR